MHTTTAYVSWGMCNEEGDGIIVSGVWSKLRVRESRGWEVIFSTPLLDKPPQRISLNTRSAGGTAGEPILAAVVGKCAS